MKLRFQLVRVWIQLQQNLKIKGLLRMPVYSNITLSLITKSQFQAGTYNLTKAMTLDELIESLKTGKVYREPVFTMTIPEGLNLKEIATVVEKKNRDSGS